VRGQRLRGEAVEGRHVREGEVYLKTYDTVREARESVGAYFSFYSNERPHKALGYRTPSDVFHSQSGAEDAVLQSADRGVEGAGSGITSSVGSRHEGNYPSSGTLS
jgi:hypothetical protein